MKNDVISYYYQLPKHSDKIGDAFMRSLKIVVECILSGLCAAFFVVFLPLLFIGVGILFGTVAVYDPALEFGDRIGFSIMSAMAIVAGLYGVINWREKGE